MRKPPPAELYPVASAISAMGTSRFGARYTGRQVDEIKLVIKQELARFDASVDSDAELTKYAQAISDGEPVEVRVGE